jgi:NADH-quinone oxidoreductase subunit M
MTMPTLLILLLVLPTATAVVVASLGPGRAPAVRRLSLACTLACLVIATVVCVDFAAARAKRTASLSPTAAARTVLLLAAPSGGPLPAVTTVAAEALSAATFRPEYVTRFDLVSFGSAKVDPIQFFVGLDGMNVWLVLLTALLMVTAVLCSWAAITDRVHEFFAWILVLQTGMTGVFLAFDIVLFYVFFELTLVPLFFLIGIWGGPEKQHAAGKFFVYTLAGSLITLLGVIGLVLTLGNDFYNPQAARMTFSIPELVTRSNDQSRRLPRLIAEAETKLETGKFEPGEKSHEVEANLERWKALRPYWAKVQFWVFLALSVGFAVKVPLVPLHTWLPLAHVEAPTAGSVLLAGVLLKLGTYGFLRLCLPLAPDASLSFGAPLIGALAVIGIVYGSFCSLAQDDYKKVIAYSSVAHLGFCMLGLFALNETGLSGGLLQMINHGLSTSGLFLLVGMLYERYHTRRMDDYGGMAARLRLLGASMVFITMASIGLPGLNGFVGEMLVLFGSYSAQGGTFAGRTLAVLGTFGILLGAWYMLTLLRQVFFGPVREPHHGGNGHVSDLNGREIATIAPIAALCLLLGLYPKPFLDSIRPEVQFVAGLADEARERGTTPEKPVQVAQQ